MLEMLIPVLLVVPWYTYVILIVVFAIKPMLSNIFWYNGAVKVSKSTHDGQKVYSRLVLKLYDFSV